MYDEETKGQTVDRAYKKTVQISEDLIEIHAAFLKPMEEVGADNPIRSIAWMAQDLRNAVENGLIPDLQITFIAAYLIDKIAREKVERGEVKDSFITDTINAVVDEFKAELKKDPTMSDSEVDKMMDELLGGLAK